MCKGDIVKPVNLILVLRFERDHHAIADCRRLSVEWLGKADPCPASGFAPGNECLEFHHSPDAHFSGDRIIKLRSARQVAGSQRYISDHDSSPLWTIEHIKNI
jgi:hypothetical protein